MNINGLNSHANGIYLSQEYISSQNTHLVLGNICVGIYVYLASSFLLSLSTAYKTTIYYLRHHNNKHKNETKVWSEERGYTSIKNTKLKKAVILKWSNFNLLLLFVNSWYWNRHLKTATWYKGNSTNIFCNDSISVFYEATRCLADVKMKVKFHIEKIHK